MHQSAALDGGVAVSVEPRVAIVLPGCPSVAARHDATTLCLLWQHGLGPAIVDRFRQIENVIQRTGQVVNIFPVDRRDERLIQPPDNIMGNPVADMFDIFDALGLLDGRVKIFHHLFEQPASFNYIMSRLLEQFKEGFFSRDQAEHHRRIPPPLC